MTFAEGSFEYCNNTTFRKSKGERGQGMQESSDVTYVYIIWRDFFVKLKLSCLTGWTIVWPSARECATTCESLKCSKCNLWSRFLKTKNFKLHRTSTDCHVYPCIIVTIGKTASLLLWIVVHFVVVILIVIIVLFFPLILSILLVNVLNWCIGNIVPAITIVALWWLVVWVVIVVVIIIVITIAIIRISVVTGIIVASCWLVLRIRVCLVIIGACRSSEFATSGAISDNPNIVHVGILSIVVTRTKSTCESLISVRVEWIQIYRNIWAIWKINLCCSIWSICWVAIVTCRIHTDLLVGWVHSDSCQKCTIRIVSNIKDMIEIRVLSVAWVGTQWTLETLIAIKVYPINTNTVWAGTIGNNKLSRWTSSAWGSICSCKSEICSADACDSCKYENDTRKICTHNEN